MRSAGPSRRRRGRRRGPGGRRRWHGAWNFPGARYRDADCVAAPGRFDGSMSMYFQLLYVMIGWRRYPITCGYHMSVRMRLVLMRHGAYATTSFDISW